MMSGHTASRSGARRSTRLSRAVVNGFTLIELMVVIVIIGLMSATVVLTMADPRGQVGTDADRFSGRVRAARDSAVINAEPVSLWVSTTGYGFDRWRKGRWEAFTEGPLVATDWSQGTHVAQGANTQTRAIFDTLGRADQSLDFALERDERQIRVRMDLDGKVTTGD